MTRSGREGVGLAGLPALRAPARFSPQTSRGVRVAWAAADIERAGHQWITKREMASNPDRWGAQVTNERGGLSCRLPDLAFQPASEPTLRVAVVVIDGQSNPRREQAALAGWQRSIVAGHYAQVQYVTGPAAAIHFRRLGTEIGLTPPQFIAGDHVIAVEPALLPVSEEPDESSVAVESARVATPDLPRPSPADVAPQCVSCEELEVVPDAAEHHNLAHELLGHDDPPRRQRWRRRAS